MRRRVDLEVHFSERFQITDIDVFALRFSETLELTTAVGECKTTEAKSAPSSGDRLLWNLGIQRLVGADAGFLATHKNASARVRALADRLGSDVMDIHDIERREQILGLNEADCFGGQHPDLVELEKTVATEVKKEDELRRVFQFLRSEFWFLSPVPGVKRSLAASRIVARYWSDQLPPKQRDTIRWLLYESVVALTVALVRIASLAYRLPEDAFRERLTERLAEGVAPFRAMKEISELVDRYVLEVLKDSGAEPAKQVDALGAFAPEPPNYTEPLFEVVERLAHDPRAARDLPRLADWRMAAALRESDDEPPDRFFPELEGTERLLRTVRAFLVGQVGLPEASLRILDGSSKAPAANPHAAGGGRKADSQISLGESTAKT